MDIESVKGQYFRQQLEKGIRDIFAAQAAVASEKLGRGSGASISSGRSGALMESLTNPRYRISDNGGGVEAEVELLTYVRFLDMRRHGNYRIYNRQVWGILYHETMANIKYEFRDWLRKRFPELLKQFDNQKK